MSIVAKRPDGSRRHLVWGRPQPRPHCCRWGPSSSFPKKGHSPQFWDLVCCGQRAGWTKMSLGTKVGLGQAALCYMGTQVPFSKRTQPPNFRPMSVVAKQSPISATAEHLFLVLVEGVRPRGRPNNTWLEVIEK